MNSLWIIPIQKITTRNIPTHIFKHFVFVFIITIIKVA